MAPHVSHNNLFYDSGHYVYEGLVLAAFDNDQRKVLANPGSSFYASVCGDDWPAEEECIGTIEDFINDFFGGKFDRSHLWYDILALTIYLGLSSNLDLLCFEVLQLHWAVKTDISIVVIGDDVCDSSIICGQMKSFDLLALFASPLAALVHSILTGDI